MGFPLHVYGSSDYHDPCAWMVRLRRPFFLAWPEDDDTRIKTWPGTQFLSSSEQPGLVEFLQFCHYTNRVYGFGGTETPPRFLFLEDPDGAWTGTLDIWGGFLFVPNEIGLLTVVPEFVIPKRL